MEGGYESDPQALYALTCLLGFFVILFVCIVAILVVRAAMS